MKKTAFIFLTLSSAAMLSAAQFEQTNNNSQYQKTPKDSNFQQTPRTVMDDEIAKDVHGVLKPTWISNGYPEVTFDVNNGTVNLRGIVESKGDKDKIEHSIKNIEGVKGINNEINIRNNQPASKSLTALNSTNTKNNTNTTNSTASKDTGTTDKDRQINTKIRDKVSKWSPTGYETFVIATSNGVVTVTGNVEKVQDIQKISSDIRSVEGVKGINNRISVKKQQH